MKNLKNTFVRFTCILLLGTGLATTALYGQTEANAKYCLDVEVEYDLKFACSSGSNSIDQEIFVESPDYSSQQVYRFYSNGGATTSLIEKKYYYYNKITSIDLSHNSYSSACSGAGSYTCPNYNGNLNPDAYYYNLAGPVSTQFNCHFPPEDKNYVTVKTFSFYPLLRLEQEKVNLGYDDDIVLKLTGPYNMLDFFQPDDNLRFRYSLDTIPDYSVGESWNDYKSCYYTVTSSDDREIRIPVKELFNEDINKYNPYINKNLYLHLDFGAREPYVFIFLLKPSLPKVLTVESIPATCSHKDDGSLKLTFDRNLQNDERLQLFWKRERAQEVSDLKSENGGWTYVYNNLSAGKDTLWVAGWSTEFSSTAITQTFPNVEITAPQPLLYSITAKKDSVCYGESNGSVTFQIQGGTPSYTLYWKKIGTDEWLQKVVSSSPYTLSELEAGEYTYYFIDENECQSGDGSWGTDERSVEIIAPDDPLTIVLDNVVEPTTHGGSDGSITFEVSGGYENYTVSYRYNNGSAIPLSSISNMYQIDGKAGNYVIEVKDKGGCSQTLAVTLTEPDLLQITITETTPITCAGEEDGVLTASVSGGVLGYDYEWSYKAKAGDSFSHKGYTAQISNLKSGIYRLAVRDHNGNGVPVDQEYTLREPESIKISNRTVKNVTCTEDDGSIRFTVSGGTGNYRVYYKNTVSGGNYRDTLVLRTSPLLNLTALTAGIYHFYIEDGNACRLDLDDIEITGPAGLLTVMEIERMEAGYNRSDGSIRASVTGGTPPYTVEWRNSSNTVLTTVTNTAPAGGVFMTEATLLPKGTYTLTVRDAAGCVQSKLFVLDERPLFAMTAEKADLLCNGESDGKITVHAVGGLKKRSAKPYDYVWYQYTNDTPVLLNTQTDSILSGIPAGKYRVEVTDSLNEMIFSVIHLLQPDTVKATITASRNISCFGGSDGTISLHLTGGTAPYTVYYLNTETETGYRSVTGAAGSLDLTVSNLTKGIYQLQVADKNNCRGWIGQLEIAAVELTQPEALRITAERIYGITAAGLDNGRIMIDVEGGTPPYTFEWKNSAGTLLPATQSPEGNGVRTAVTGLPEGDYTVTVKDANYTIPGNACFLTQTYAMFCLEPLEVSVTVIPVNCYGDSTGKISAYAKGGLPAETGKLYQYTWYQVEGATETLLSNRNDSVLAGLPAGRYKVKIEDAAVPVNTVTATAEITQPELLETTLTTRNVSCYQGNDAFIRIQIGGGVRPYTCFCRQNGVDADYRTLILNASDASDTFALNSLRAGDYSIFIVDNNGCNARINGQETIVVRIEQPAQALQIAQSGSVNPSGYGRSDGELFIEVSGGTAPYTVHWKDAQGRDLTGQESSGGIFRSTLSNLTLGDYSVEVFDSSYASAYPGANTGCTTAATFTLKQPDSLKVSIAETHFVSCNGMSDGELLLTATGGVAKATGTPYIYQWFVLNGSSYVPLSGQTRDRLENVPAGSYRVQVTDYSRTPNVTTCDYVLVQPEALAAVATQKEIDCGQTTPLSVSVSGGTPPYRYYWSTGDNTPSVASVSAGKYFVIVRDARDCEITALANIQSPSDLKVSGSVAHPNCHGVSNGSITVQVSGGKTPYSYQWNTGSRSKNLENVPAGYYTLMVSDAAGCSYTGSFELTEPPALSVKLGEDRILCAGQETTFIPVVSESNVRYSWTGPNNFRSTASQVSVQAAGTYQLTITNTSGCQASSQVNVRVDDRIISSEIVVSSQVFVGDTVVIVNISNPQPDKVEWLLPASDSLVVLEKGEHLAKILFEFPGLYTIGIRTHSGDCYQDLLKAITAVPAGERDRDSFGESPVKKFTVSPNPNKGTFTVDVELNREAAIRLRIIGIGSGVTVSDKFYASQTEFSIPYRLVLPAGVYVVLLETASGYVHVKMIVN